MAATGELIRLINYVDDITATLRRITASIPTVDQEERTRLAEHLRAANADWATLLAELDSVKK